MKIKSTKFFLPVLFIILSSFAYSQSKSVNRGVGGENDQIAEMLDSLVSVKFLARTNLKKASISNKYNFQPEEVPIYPDDVLAQRIQKIQSPIPLAYNAEVKRYIDLYLVKRRDLSSISLGLSKLYFPLFEQTLDFYGLPLELKYLSVVESALNPNAVSRMGATGLWQFMYGTGKMYNLEINSFIDERRDVQKSTVAACQYFRDMYSIYHDWLLVIAAYNCGPGNVNKAIARSGGKTNFWEISKYLPKETRGYVPAFIAVNYMMTYANEHNIAPVPCAISYFDLDTLKIRKQLSLNQVAITVGLPLELLRFLNPVYKRNILPGGEKGCKLVLPSSKISAFIAGGETIYKDIPIEFAPYPSGIAVKNKRAIKTLVVNKPEETATSIEIVKTVEPAPKPVEIVKDIRKVHIVKENESVQNIAKLYNCTLAEINGWNRIKGPVRHGDRIIIYMSSHEELEKKEVASAKDLKVSADTQQDQPKAKKQYIYHVVQPGDTLWNIAQKYAGVTVQQLKQLNRISSARALKPGTKIKVIVQV